MRLSRRRRRRRSSCSISGRPGASPASRSCPISSACRTSTEAGACRSWPSAPTGRTGWPRSPPSSAATASRCPCCWTRDPRSSRCSILSSRSPARSCWTEAAGSASPTRATAPGTSASSNGRSPLSSTRPEAKPRSRTSVQANESFLLRLPSEASGDADQEGYAEVLDQLDLTVSNGGFLVGARVDLALGFSPFEPSLRLAKRYAQYSTKDLRARAGDFYTSLGRGLVFSLVKVFEEEGLDYVVDTTVDGGQVAVAAGPVSGEVFGGWIDRPEDRSVRDKVLGGTRRLDDVRRRDDPRPGRERRARTGLRVREPSRRSRIGQPGASRALGAGHALRRVLAHPAPGLRCRGPHRRARAVPGLQAALGKVLPDSSR